MKNINQYKKENERLISLLKKVQWNAEPNCCGACVYCYCYEWEEHSEDCELNNLLHENIGK